MLHGISRHYSQPASLAAFLRKVANQLIKRSLQHLLTPGKLWEQDRASLVAALGAAGQLHAAFEQHAGQVLGAAAATGAAAEAARREAEQQAVAKYGLFARRCAKLAEMFSTVHQFAQLAQHTHIQGVSAVLAKFGEVGGLVGGVPAGWGLVGWLRGGLALGTGPTCACSQLAVCSFQPAASAHPHITCSPPSHRSCCPNRRPLSPPCLPPCPTRCRTGCGGHQEAALRPARLLPHPVRPRPAGVQRAGQ